MFETYSFFTLIAVNDVNCLRLETVETDSFPDFASLSSSPGVATVSLV